MADSHDIGNLGGPGDLPIKRSPFDHLPLYPDLVRRARRDDDDDDDDDGKFSDKPRGSARKRGGDDDDGDDGPPAKKKSGGGFGMGVILVILGVLGVCCVCIPGVGGVGGWFIIQKARQSAEQATAMNNVRELVIACHTYETQQNELPSPRMQPEPGQKDPPNLSWRVAVLKFHDANAWGMMDKTQAWDSPKNQAKLAPMPRAYRWPPDRDTTSTQTKFQFFTGEKTLYPTELTRVKLTQITDGSSNTFLIGEAATAVTWSKPGDMAIGAGALPLPADRFLVGMADGAARIVDRKKTSDDILRKLIDPRDGNVVPDF